MKELKQAIVSYFNADTTSAIYVDVAGRLYDTEAPQKTVFPYIVFSLVDNIPSYARFNTNYEFGRIQFSLFSSNKTSAVEVENMYTHLKDRFDFCPLSVSGYNTLYMRRDIAFQRKDDEYGYWQYVVQYTILMDKT